MHKPEIKKQFNLETYETLVAFHGDILFEWNLENDRFYTTSNLFDIFGYMPPGENFTATLEQSENIHPEDKEVIKEYLNNIQFTCHDLTNRKYYSKLEIRIKNIYRKYVWCKIQLIANYSAQNMPYKISGMITNIDFDKKHQETLLTQAQKDLLTGLYNKATTHKLISDWIETPHTLNKAGVLVLIDLAGFKAINDHFGHLFGDAVIADTATIINAQFLESDIAGRMGGDEFIVFIKEISSIAELKIKLKQLTGKLNRTYHSDDTTYAVSVSIGISLYPAHGKNYEELFTRADQALYYIKQNGKNEFMIYRDKLPKTLHKEKITETIPSGRSFDDNLIEYIFKILYNTRDHHAAIEMLLAVLGKKLKVSRTFVYLKSKDNKYYSKTFEWCDSGVARIDSQLNEIDINIVDKFYQSMDQNNLLICNNIAELTIEEKRYFKHVDTRSCLHARIMHDHKPHGYIGFDECRHHRDWTPYEISLINFLADVLMTFISKQETLKELQHLKENFANLLNAVDEYLYVVDPVTHGIVYFNDKMHSLLNETAGDGQKCYEQIYHLTQPCTSCPLSGGETGTDDEAPDENQRQWFSKTASNIKWLDNRACCLVKLAPIAEQKNSE